MSQPGAEVDPRDGHDHGAQCRNVLEFRHAELKRYRYFSGSGKEIERCFCGTCGSPIFTLHPAKPEYVWVKAGIINQPEVVKPAYENWTKDKVKWRPST